MRKELEQGMPDSCFNKAADAELIFVLRAKDPAASDTVRYWANRRVELGLNLPTDDKIATALAEADAMDVQRTTGVV